MNDKRYRIPVDFQEIERNALTALCVQDYRQPEDQIRFLVTREAERRGLLPKMNDCTGLTFQGETGAIVAANL